MECYLRQRFVAHISDQSTGRDFTCEHSGTGLGLHSLYSQVPNRFLSKEDINFTPKSRFKEDSKPYSNLLRREEESYDNSQSEPSPSHPRFQGCKSPPSSSEHDTPIRIPSERLCSMENEVIADRKPEEEKAAEQALTHLTSGRGYTKFIKPPQTPFTDESQLVLQYFVTGRQGVGTSDLRTVPHNTPALLREGTHLSTVALHAAYTCAVWRAFSPNTRNSVLIPRIPRFDHYGLQRSGPTSGEGSSSHTAPATSSHTIFPGQQQQLGEPDTWDLLLGWLIPSVVARQKAEMRRKRDMEREARNAKVRQWNSAVVQSDDSS